MSQDRRYAATLLTIYVAYIFYFGMAPFTFHWDAGLSARDILEQRFEGMASVWRVTWWDIWTNILLYVPLGWLLVRLPSIAPRHRSVALIAVMASAALLSLGIELAQTLLPRLPSLVDIACNTLGAVLGGLVGLLAYPAWRDWYVRWVRPRLSARSAAIMLAGYWTGVCLLFSVPLPLSPDFSNWDPSFDVKFGTEPSVHPPWRGVFYQMALYDRALSREEIHTSFSAGPRGGPAWPPAGHGVVAGYDFTEQTGMMVHDRAGVPPADVYIEDPSLVRWQAPQGLAIVGSAGLSSQPGATRAAHNRLSASTTMSLEAWIAPADVSQPGPDAFVSSANSGDHRNFALAQDGADLVFWLRTPLTGSTGRKAELRTEDQPLTTELQHVVVTYAPKTAILYVNGCERARMTLDRRQALLDSIIDLIGSYYEAGLRSVFLFPLGVLSYRWLSPLKPAWWPVAAVGAAGLLEATRTLVLRSQFDSSLAAVSAGTVVIAGLTTMRLLPAGRHRRLTRM
jgi:VanZ family protein